MKAETLLNTIFGTLLTPAQKDFSSGVTSYHLPAGFKVHLGMHYFIITCLNSRKNSRRLN